VVVLLCICVAVSHFNRISITVAGTERIIPSGVDPAWMGSVYSAYLFIYTFCMVPGGWFIDRFGPRKALMVVCFGSTLFVALTGATGWLSLTPFALVLSLLCVRSVMGAVNAPIHPGSARMVALWVLPGARNLCNGLATAAACMGIASTYVIFGLLMDWLEWPGAFVAAATATGLLALVWTAFSSDRPDEPADGNVRSAQAATPGWSEFAALLQNPSLMLITLSYGLLSYFQYLFFYWIQHYFNTALGVSNEMGRWYATLLTLAMGAGMIAGGLAADLLTRALGRRWGMAIMPVLGLLGAAVFLVLGLARPQAVFALVCFSLSMFGAGAAEGPYWTTATTLGGRRGGTAAAILNTGGNGVGLLAPIVTPLVSARYGWEAAVGLAAVTCTFGAALWLFVRPVPQEVTASEECEASEP
jgi:MFS family permease